MKESSFNRAWMMLFLAMCCGLMRTAIGQDFPTAEYRFRLLWPSEVFERVLTGEQPRALIRFGRAFLPSGGKLEGVGRLSGEPCDLQQEGGNMLMFGPECKEVYFSLSLGESPAVTSSFGRNWSGDRTQTVFGVFGSLPLEPSGGEAELRLMPLEPITLKLQDIRTRKLERFPNHVTLSVQCLRKSAKYTVDVTENEQVLLPHGSVELWKFVSGGERPGLGRGMVQLDVSPDTPRELELFVADTGVYLTAEDALADSNPPKVSLRMPDSFTQVSGDIIISSDQGEECSVSINRAGALFTVDSCTLSPGSYRWEWKPVIYASIPRPIHTDMLSGTVELGEDRQLLIEPQLSILTFEGPLAPGVRRVILDTADGEREFKVYPSTVPGFSIVLANPGTCIIRFQWYEGIRHEEVPDPIQWKPGNTLTKVLE